MSNDLMQDYIVEQMRLQRHEFMNYLQVIYGYIQINRPQEAVNYIKEINKKMTLLSQLFNLECSDFSLLLQDFILHCYKYGIEVDFSTELEYISCELFSKNIYEKSKLFDSIKDIIVNELEDKNGKINICVKEENKIIRILFSNENELDCSSFEGIEPRVIANNKELGYKLYSYKVGESFLIIFDNY